MHCIITGRCQNKILFIYLFIYFFKLNEINISKNGRVEVKKLVRHLYNLDFIVITIIMMEIFKKERSDEV